MRGIEAPSICAFGQEPYTIFVVGKDGSFLRANFKNGGEAQRISYNRFLKGPDDVLKVDGGGDSASGGTAEESNLHEVTGEKGFADLPVEKGE